MKNRTLVVSKIFLLSFMLLGLTSAAMAQECPVKTLEDTDASAVSSWKTQVDAYIAKPSWFDLHISVKGSSKAKVSAAQINIINKIEAQKIGSLHCVMSCQIYAEKIRLQDLKKLLETVLQQNDQAKATCAKFDQEQATKRANFERAQAILRAQAEAEEAKQNEIRAKAEEAKSLQNEKLNKNTRPQIPAIAGDWYLLPAKADENASSNTTTDDDEDSKKVSAEHPGQDVVRIFISQGPKKTISMVSCNTYVYWISNATICVPLDTDGLKPNKYSFNSRLNGFCPAKDSTDSDADKDSGNDDCAAVYQVSNKDARKLIYVESPFSKLEQSEKDKAGDTFVRVDGQTKHPKSNGFYPTTQAAVEAAVKAISGQWAPVEIKKTEDDNSSLETPDSAGRIAASKIPGVIDVQWCNKDVWASTDGHMCQQSSDTEHYYYQPLFGGFCFLKDSSNADCSYGIKIQNGKLNEKFDPIGTNDDKRKGQTFHLYTKH